MYNASIDLTCDSSGSDCLPSIIADEYWIKVRVCVCVHVHVRVCVHVCACAFMWSSEWAFRWASMWIEFRISKDAKRDLSLIELC